MKITKKQLIRLIQEQYVDQKYSDIKKMLTKDLSSQKGEKGWIDTKTGWTQYNPVDDDYYFNEQFSKINQMPISFQFHSNGRKTNYINLDKESAKFLMNWLKKIYKKLN